MSMAMGSVRAASGNKACVPLGVDIIGAHRAFDISDDLDLRSAMKRTRGCGFVGQWQGTHIMPEMVRWCSCESSCHLDEVGLLLLGEKLVMSHSC